jgi:hypothetical protein
MRVDEKSNIAVLPPVEDDEYDIPAFLRRSAESQG